MMSLALNSGSSLVPIILTSMFWKRSTRSSVDSIYRLEKILITESSLGQSHNNEFNASVKLYGLVLGSFDWALVSHLDFVLGQLGWFGLVEVVLPHPSLSSLNCPFALVK